MQMRRLFGVCLENDLSIFGLHRTHRANVISHGEQKCTNATHETLYHIVTCVSVSQCFSFYFIAIGNRRKKNLIALSTGSETVPGLDEQFEDEVTVSCFLYWNAKIKKHLASVMLRLYQWRHAVTSVSFKTILGPFTNELPFYITMIQHNWFPFYRQFITLFHVFFADSAWFFFIFKFSR